MKRLRIVLCFAVALVACAGPGLAERDLSSPNDTVATALAEAQQALQQRPIAIQINTVGLGVQGDQNAVAYLQQMAAIGAGHYYEATGPEDVEQALAGAATGAPSQFSGAPVILAPRNGEIVGPSTVVKGHATPGALVVVWTAVYNARTGELIKRVPGIRHRTKEDGSFEVRISTPRISFGQDVPLRYEIHAQMLDASGKRSLEAIVTVASPK